MQHPMFTIRHLNYMYETRRRHLIKRGDRHPTDPATQWSNYRKISKGPIQLRSRRSGNEAQSAEGVGSGGCLEPLAILGMLNWGGGKYCKFVLEEYKGLRNNE